ncbi:MAG: heavy metal transporter, partial [Elusimicrobia bacterium]|nr:heavy metal transporter [Elusimicrobiota bacterium]
MDWKARAERLALFTVLYNLLEGGVSVWFGVSESSVALAGFGADSFIEVASAAAVLWRLRGGAEERRATRAIGALLLALASATAAASGLQLYGRNAPDTTLPGALIALASLSFMFWLWRAKLAAGRALSSPTVLADASCSLACIKLSGVLLAGSAAYALVPALWWADSAAALALSVLIAREGPGLLR